MRAKTKIGNLMALQLAAIAVLLPWSASAKTGAGPVEMTWPGGSGKVELIIRDDRAELVSHELGGTTRRLRMIATSDDALAVLADERLAFTWPALLSWAGDDLHILRDRSLARAKAAAEGKVSPLPPEDDYQKNIGNENRATLQYIKALNDAGHMSEALTFARERLAAQPRGSLGNFMRSQLNLAIAATLFRDGTWQETIDWLRNALADKAQDSPFKLAEKSTLAATLVRVGRYDEALEALDTAIAANSALKTGLFSSVGRVPEVEYFYVAIRGCALYGLGRQEEASALFTKIAVNPSMISGWSPGSAARYMGISCTHDADWVAQEIAREITLASPAGTVFDMMQAAILYTPDRKVRDEALTRDVVIKARAGRVRQLGGPLAPALRGWLPETAAPN